RPDAGEPHPAVGDGLEMPLPGPVLFEQQGAGPAGAQRLPAPLGQDVRVLAADRCRAQPAGVGRPRPGGRPPHQPCEGPSGHGVPSSAGTGRRVSDSTGTRAVCPAGGASTTSTSAVSGAAASTASRTISLARAAPQPRPPASRTRTVAPSTPASSAPASSVP